ncbi:MAG: gamma-glutamylcyclotransferase [Rhodospirillales bacterium]|nr:gamma-glutamylcyclotransferase [Rhodospirillales bacterium]
MKLLFLYGSLLDPAQFQRVTGLPLAGVRALLPGWRRVAMTYGPYPTLRRDAGSVVEGLLVRVDGRAFAKLSDYEGPRWRLREVVPVVDGRAVVARAWIAAGGSRRPWP